MRVLIGYSMRSGSTVLSHVPGGHSMVRAYGDLSSALALPPVAKPRPDGIGRHRHVLTAAQQSVFRHHLGLEMERLGYTSAPGCGDGALPVHRTVA